MKTLISGLLAVLASLGLAEYAASAHPASGIVVDEQGQVFFIHTGYGVCKIDGQGKLSYIHQSRGGHWMCLDTEGSFSRTQPKHFERITLPGVKPAIIFADGGSPIAVLPDGNLYYVSNDDAMTPGGLQLTRHSPKGMISLFAPGLKKITEKLGITGLASGPGGDLYVTCPSAIFRVKTDGTFVTVVRPIVLPDCDVDYPDGNTNMALPSLRGLAVDEHGTVFAAGTGCHRVVKITPQGTVQTVLSSERPWAPTGVAFRDGQVYVLEYTNANAGRDQGWWPRVRRLERDGRITTLATISPEGTLPMPSNR